MPKPRTIGRWSLRSSGSNRNGDFYGIYPKGDRSEWARRASLYPASDGHSYVFTINGEPLDARPSLDEAVAAVIAHLDKEV